jgi:primosomal protein N' (replication factor Y)
MKAISVAVNINTYKQFSYYYEGDNNLLFKRVKIPFGKYSQTGVVTKYMENYKEGRFKTKKILEVLDERVFINKEHFDYLELLNKRLLLPPGKTFNLSYPPFYDYDGKINFFGEKDKNKKSETDVLSLNIGFSFETIIRSIKEDINNSKKIKMVFPDYFLLKQFSSFIKKSDGLSYSEISSGKKRKEFWNRYLKGEFNIVSGILYPMFIPDFEKTIYYVIDEAPLKFTLFHPFPVNLTDVAFLNYHKNRNLRFFSLSPSIKTYKFVKENNGIINKNGDKRKNIYFAKPKNRVLPKEIKEEIKDNLSEKKILLIVNRTGVKNYLYCPRCKTIALCPKDKSPLSFDEKTNTVFCPVCKKEFKFPMRCELCNNNYIIIKKRGTNTIKNSLEKYLTEVETADKKNTEKFIEVYSRKVVGKTKEEERIFKRFKKGDTSILIGTNLAIKPFEFKNLSLIIYFYPELDLSNINPENSEKIFYNLEALSRMIDKEGKIIIKSDYPDFYVIDEFKNYDYEHFFKTEMEIREKLEYFPVQQFIKVEVRAVKKGSGLKKIKKYKKLSEDYKSGVKIFGPFHSQKRDYSSFYLILKENSMEKLLNLINNIILPESDNSTFFYINRL